MDRRVSYGQVRIARSQVKKTSRRLYRRRQILRTRIAVERVDGKYSPERLRRGRPEYAVRRRPCHTAGGTFRRYLMNRVFTVKPKPCIIISPTRYGRQTETSVGNDASGFSVNVRQIPRHFSNTFRAVKPRTAFP